ncbi:hypothetical protein MLW98_004462 [Klebsiella variicola]|nr:hypothetical protein [Klebsiella variicola]
MNIGKKSMNDFELIGIDYYLSNHKHTSVGLLSFKKKEIDANNNNYQFCSMLYPNEHDPPA